MHADIKSVLYAGSRDELNAKLFERDKLLAEWRDWYRAAIGTGYSEASLAGRTDEILKR